MAPPEELTEDPDEEETGVADENPTEEDEEIMGLVADHFARLNFTMDQVPGWKVQEVFGRLKKERKLAHLTETAREGPRVHARREAFRKRITDLKAALVAEDYDNAMILYRGGKIEIDGHECTFSDIEDDNIILEIFCELIGEALSLEWEARREALRKARRLVMDDRPFIPITPAAVRYDLEWMARQADINARRALENVFPEFSFPAPVGGDGKAKEDEETALEELYVYEGIELNRDDDESEIFEKLHGLDLVAVEIIEGIAQDEEMLREAGRFFVLKGCLTIGEQGMPFRNFISSRMRALAPARWAVYALLIFGSGDDKSFARTFLNGRPIMEIMPTEEKGGIHVENLEFWDGMSAQQARAALIRLGELSPMVVLNFLMRNPLFIEQSNAVNIVQENGETMNLRDFALEISWNAMNPVTKGRRITAEKIHWWAVAALHIFGREREQAFELVARLPEFALGFENGFPRSSA